MAVIYLIRHGQASFSEDDYDALSPLGFQQAAKLGEQLGRLELVPNKVFAGAMRRHRETCETALTAMGCTDTPWQKDARLNEYDHEEVLRTHWPLFADKPGMREWFMQQEHPKNAFSSIFAQAISHWQDNNYDYQESWQDFCARVEAGFDALCEQAVGNTLVFTSGGVISVILKKILQLEVDSFQAFSRTLVNTGVTRVVLRDGQPMIASVNEQLHLPKNLISYR